MDKRQTTLCMGYLVKSPTKSKDKTSLPMFWKIRWCVFAKIAYFDRHGRTLGTRLVLCYYESKEAYGKDAAPKGCLNITTCSEIKSCYKSTAGFDHILKICWPKGSYVKFSAPTCQMKFEWITTLYNYKFNTNIKGVTRSRVLTRRNRERKRLNRSFERSQTSGSSSSGDSEKTEQLLTQSRAPINEKSNQSTSRATVLGSDLEMRDSSLRRDSGRFSMSTVSSFTDNASTFKRTDDELSSINELRIESKQIVGDDCFVGAAAETIDEACSIETLAECANNQSSVFHNLFTLCERCQNGEKNQGNSLKRRLSSRKRSVLSNEDPFDIVVQRSSDDFTSQQSECSAEDSLFSEDAFHEEQEQEGIYIEIDPDWLSRVQQLMGDYINDDEFENDSLECYPDDDIYMRMDIFTSPNTDANENKHLSCSENSDASAVDQMVENTSETKL